MTPHERFGIPEPDVVGSAEYRAIYECLDEGLQDVAPFEHTYAAAVLHEFEHWARSLRTQLENEA